MASPQLKYSASTSSRYPIFDAESTLDQLISHFVAAKASLSSVSHVYRANEIVEAARHSLEKLASLDAKNNFLLESITSQLQIAKTTRQSLGVKAETTHADFKVYTPLSFH